MSHATIGNYLIDLIRARRSIGRQPDRSSAKAAGSAETDPTPEPCRQLRWWLRLPAIEFIWRGPGANRLSG